MPVGAFIIARLNSSRLTEKHMRRIMGKPMIEMMVERVRAAKTVDNIVITTSNLSSDDQLEELSKKFGIYCYRGSLENIMDRIVNAAKTYECDTVVELLGDNPLVHSELIDEVVNYYFKNKYDYVATATNEYPISGKKYLFPVGIRVQVYSVNAAEQYIKYPEYINNENKHPCSYIFEHPESFNIGYLEAKDKWCFLNHPNLNFAVNYQENFEMVRQIFENCYFENSNFSMNDIMQTVDLNQDLKLLMGNKPIINNEI